MKLSQKLFIACLIALPLRATAQLAPNDRLAITGDSITEQKMYSVYIEDYLLACKPFEKVSAMQFGWGGEQVPGFVGRMANDCLQFKPTIATTCYGMNDGHYTAMTPQIADAYRQSSEQMIDLFTKANVKVVLGSPGCVDVTTFKHGDTTPQVYNATLAAERDIDRDLAAKHNLAFADVFQPMFDVMTKAKAKYGNDYPLVGKDGVHPGPNGHLVMAYAFLKAMGVNGDIGTISVDLGASKATATDGHKIQSFEGDSIMIESSRYPFCFLARDQRLAEHMDNPENPRGVLPFLPFNADLNRFTLIVTGASSQNLKVTWGNDTKTFSAEQLAKGINLADEFLDNPLASQFKKIDDAVRTKQNFETPAIKGLMNLCANILPDAKELDGAMVTAVKEKDEQLAKAATDAAVPVSHMIRIQAVQ